MPLSQGELTGFVLLDLALIIGVARLVGSFFVRLGQPRVVGEIVAGVLLGPSLLGPAVWPGFEPPAALACAEVAAGTVASPSSCLFPAQARDVVGVIGQVGLLLFMFLTGLAADRNVLARRRRLVISVGFGVVAIPLAIGVAMAGFMANDTFKAQEATTSGFSLFVGAIMAVTAFPVLVRILQERNLQTSPLGVISIGSAAVCTVVMFITTTIATALATDAGGIVVRLALIVAYLAVVWYGVKPLLRRLSSVGDIQFFFAAIGLLFASGYVAHLLGLTVIVGGFVAGLAMPTENGESDRFNGRLGDVAASILLPVFLAYSGLNTDFSSLTLSALGGVALLLIGGVVSKWLGGAVVGRAAGLPWDQASVLGILMNCRGLLVLVVALEGLKADVISPALQVGAVVMALTTTAMTGPLMNRFGSALHAHSEEASRI